MKEGTGAEGIIIRLIGVYSGPKRDPMGTTMTAAFLMRFIRFAKKHDNEVSEVRFFPLNKTPKLAFDHEKIMNHALKLLRQKKIK